MNLLMRFAYARSSAYGTSRAAGGKTVAGVARSSVRVAARRVRMLLICASRAVAVVRRVRILVWLDWCVATVGG